MHEHTPSEEVPEPTEAADPTGAILLHVLLTAAVLMLAGLLAAPVSHPGYGVTIDLNGTVSILVWLCFAVYVVLSTVGAVRNWRNIGRMIGFHVGALVLAVPGGIALLFLWVWLGSLFLA